MTTGRITAATRRLADDNSRLDLIDQTTLLQLLHEHFGPRWPHAFDFYLTWPPRELAGPT